MFGGALLFVLQIRQSPPAHLASRGASDLVMKHEFLGMALLAVLAGCGVRRGDTVIIPASYEGWVQIHYEVKGSPELPKEGWNNLIVVPSSGIVKTGSVRAPGYGQDHYFLIDASGVRTEIPSVYGREADGRAVSGFQYFSSPTRAVIFFVGDGKKMVNYKRPIPEEFVGAGAK